MELGERNAGFGARLIARLITLPALAASFPAVVGSVFGTLKELTGVDVQSMLASTGTGGAR